MTSMDAINQQNIFQAQAPSNIALIKYMGKQKDLKNQGTNSSISYTLPHLYTEVNIEVTKSIQAKWVPQLNSHLELSDAGLKKFIAHWDRCHQRLAPRFQKGVIITSGNNFPSDCGLASSASSFAALTQASYLMFKELGYLEKEWTPQELAQLSREGSGSSCRSFFAPWCYWSQDQVHEIESTWKNLFHSVIIVDGHKKKVSSSEAHERVMTSTLFKGRIERAEERAQLLQKLLKKSDSWYSMFELVWSEFWDMHVLFETSSPPFYYMTSKSIRALRFLQEDWETRGDGPLITMDAGPNIHLLYRPDQKDLQGEHLQRLHNIDLATLSDFSNL